LLGPHGVDQEGFDLLVATTSPQQRPQIPFAQAEKARAHLAIGGDAQPAARAAERPRHWRDDTDTGVWRCARRKPTPCTAWAFGVWAFGVICILRKSEIHRCA